MGFYIQSQKIVLEKTINTTTLINKTCIPCRGDTHPLKPQIANNLLGDLGKGWQINPLGHLDKKFSFKNFKEAMAFANSVADIAEKEAHHPDLKISWGMCAIEIWTHKINDLTESDFILAAKIEEIP